METIGNPALVTSAGLVIILVQAIKPIDQISPKLYPLISLALGICIALLQDMTLIEGVMIGGAASGTYSGVKRVME